MKRKAIIAAILIASITSCHKGPDKTTTSGSTFIASAFPLKTGNWWRYQVSNFYVQSIDTLTLKVVSMNVTGMTKNYACTVSQSGSIVDSGYFIFSDTSLFYNGKNPQYSYLGYFNLRLPFAEGQKWPGIYPADTFTAVGIAPSLRVLGSSYSPVFALHRIITDVHFSNVQFMFLTPGIGIIQQSIDIQSDTFGVQQENFELIDYNLN